MKHHYSTVSRVQSSILRFSILLVICCLQFLQQVNAQAVPKLKQLEYYIDTDPGYGLGIPVALDTLTDFNNYVVPINVTGLATGDHHFFVRGLDKNGSWSLVNSWTFNIPATLASPTIVVNSMTQTTRCARDSFYISYDATGTYNAGNVFNAELSDKDGNFGSPTIIGSYTGTANSIIKVKLPSHLPDGTGYKIRVSSTNAVVTGIANDQTITIHDRPSAQTITGAGDANATYSYPYSVPTVGGSTWKWIVGAATVTPTNNTADLLWNTQGQPQQVRVVETNQYGCPGDTSIKPVNVYQLKIDNVNVSSLTPCPDGDITVTAGATGVYDGGNVFTAQLSDATGSFASPVNIGTVVANPVGLSQAINISATLPKPMANGTGYRVRVISNSPSVTGSDNGQNITVDKPELGANQSTTISCANGTADITTLYNTTGYTNVAYNDATPAAVAAGSYSLIVTNSNGCKDTAYITVMPARIETVVSTGGISKGSNRECTDADGWTHYYNNNGTPDDYSDDDRIMSIKKNGNDIGTVGMGGGNQFMVSLISVTGAGGGQGIDVQSPLVGSGNHYFSMYRYWDIGVAKQPLTPVNIRFYFHTSDLNDINGSLGTAATPDQLTAYHLPDGNADPSQDWAGATSVEFYQSGATPSLSNWAYTDLGNGIGQAEFMVSSFSGGGLGFYQMGPVPVRFISFNAAAVQNNVVLSWSTASETNSDRFEIQRSPDGTHFETIGTVAAADNSNTVRTYSYEDQSVSALAGSDIYYRILQVDKDGRKLLSDVRHVNLSFHGSALTLLYNPVKEVAVLHYFSTENANAVIRIVDQLGRVQLTRQVSVIKGLNEIKMPTKNIAKGIYIAELISYKDHGVVRFLKE